MTAEPQVFGPMDLVLLEHPPTAPTVVRHARLSTSCGPETIRLWDVVVVAKDADGNVRAVEIDELPADIPRTSPR